MAKASVAFVASALVILAIAGSAHCHRKEAPGKVVVPSKEFVVNVTGSVSCNPCRLYFPTKLNHNIAGATVEFTCGEGRAKKIGKTDANGIYEISVSGVREGDECSVKVTQTPPGSVCIAPSAHDTCSLVDGVDSVAAAAAPYRCDQDIMLRADKVDPKCIDQVLNEGTYPAY